MSPRAGWSAAILLLVAACGDGGTGPATRLEVTPGDVTLTAVSDSVVVTASLAGEPVASLKLAMKTEAREVAALPVVSGEALARGVIRPAGPGTAVVRVRSGSDEGQVTVRVAPAAPTVFDVVTTARPAGPDTVSLLGSRLDQVPLEGSVTLAGQPVTLLSRSSSALRFLLPEIEPGTCGGGALTAPVAVAGVQVAAGLEAPLGRAGEVRMPVGGYRILTAEEAACVRLPATGGEYVLAWADLRAEIQGRDGFSGLGHDPYTVTVRDLSSAAPAASHASGRAGFPLTGGHTVRTLDVDIGRVGAAGPIDRATAVCSDEDFTALTFWCRSKPWSTGDSMRIRTPGALNDTVSAHVWQVFGGRFAFAVVDGHDSDNLRAFKAAIEDAMPDVLNTSVPLFQAVFGDVQPVSSRGSGQILTVIGDFQHSSVGAGCCQADGPWAVVTLGSWHANWESEIFYLLTHEFAHVWQNEWYFATRAPDGAAQPFVVWGVEGGADLLAYEAVRRFAGVPWGANRTLFSFADGANRDGPLVREIWARGEISAGYEHASSFLRHIVADMVADGAVPDAAFRDVALGALEDWHGWEWTGTRRTGLTGRVRATLGESWSPAEALLVYTLAQGADDRTTSPKLQNPFYYDVGRALQDDGFGSTTLRAGEGATASTSRVPTSTGLVRLVDGGAGSSFSTGSDRGGVGWAIARLR